ncbi:hypothetical protein HDU96_007060 [Phlyctochytrium bullatum]|nr:hypothetical protein HDU96_007060 [Phlyctochytrium bullatum]
MNFKLWLSCFALLLAAIAVQVAFANELNPDYPLKPGERKQLKKNIANIDEGKASNAGSGTSVKTYINDIGGGFRLDNQGEKGDGKVHLAVQKNGDGNGIRTTHAQVALEGSHDGVAIKRGLQRSLRTGKVVTLTKEQGVARQQGVEWARNRAQNPQRAVAGQAVKAQRAATRAARIANNQRKDPDRQRNPNHNVVTARTQARQARTAARREAREKQGGNQQQGRRGGNQQQRGRGGNQQQQRQGQQQQQQQGQQGQRGGKRGRGRR